MGSLVLLYVVTGRLGLAMSYGHQPASLVWPPAGVALGAFLILGYRAWPAVLGSAVVVYLTANVGSLPASLAIACGNTLEGIVAAYLVNRYAGGLHALQNPRNALRFAGVVLLASATVGATTNALVAVTSGVGYWSDYGALWMIMCLGSAIGMMVLAPPILLFSQASAQRWRRPQQIETAAALCAVVCVGLIAFWRFPIELRGFPTEFLCVPILLWSAFRLGKGVSSSALLMLSVLAISGTLEGYGPFVRTTPLASLWIVMFFVGVTAVMTYALAALASDYAIAEAQLRELVVTDPLTGLPNYRRLVEVLGSEIARSDRHNRPFAIVFLDMDNLKGINDELGHVVGSRAVCRLAETLRATCRTTDTAARYGGDEFVAVLSDTDYEGAQLVIRRLSARLADDPDKPQISVSCGVALYPKDGGTPTTLLSAADRALYAVKSEKALSRRRNVVGIRESTHRAIS